jgi:hypothetical protein
MAELISIAANYPSTEFDTLIPELTDPADIREAFLAYHYGVSNFDGSTDVPAAQSIHSHIETFKDLLTSIGASAILSLSGTANEITLSGSTGFVTIGLPDDVTIGDDLTVNDQLTVTGTSTLNGTAIFNNTTQAKVGINIFANSGARNSALTSPVEGTLAYLQDTNEQTIYSGSSWVSIENHGTLGARIDNTEVLALLGL